MCIYKQPYLVEFADRKEVFSVALLLTIAEKRSIVATFTERRSLSKPFATLYCNQHRRSSYMQAGEIKAA
jgi:hypothetical protein